MNISFGICLGPNEQYVHQLVNSIMRTIQCSPFFNFGDPFEILIAGNPSNEIMTKLSSDFGSSLFIFIPSDDSRPGWITKKKNSIAQVARYENLCIVHDYLEFDDQWLTGVISTDAKYKDWQVMLNKVQNLDGTRHADWIVSPECMLEVIAQDREKHTSMLMAAAPHENGPQYVNSLPYDVQDLSYIQYISGGSFLIKTHVLLTTPMNENMIWGDPPGEDVEWSRRLSMPFHFNPHSLMKIQKPGKWKVSQMPYEFVTALRNYYGSNPVQ